jgi:hypothetical protein
MSQNSITKCRISPTPELLIGFPTYEEARKAAAFVLNAPVAELDKQWTEWLANPENNVIRPESPEPPTLSGGDSLGLRLIDGSNEGKKTMGPSVDLDAPMEIVCKKHGSFFMVAQHHLDGAGCPTCERLALISLLARLGETPGENTSNLDLIEVIGSKVDNRRA